MTIKAIDGRVKWFWVLVLAVIAAALWAINANAQGPTGAADPLAPAPTSAVDPGAQPAGAMVQPSDAVDGVIAAGMGAANGKAVPQVAVKPFARDGILTKSEGGTGIAALALGIGSMLNATGVAKIKELPFYERGVSKPNQEKASTGAGLLSENAPAEQGQSFSGTPSEAVATADGCAGRAGPGGNVTIDRTSSGSCTVEVNASEGHGSGTK